MKYSLDYVQKNISSFQSDYGFCTLRAQVFSNVIRDLPMVNDCSDISISVHQRHCYYYSDMITLLSYA